MGKVSAFLRRAARGYAHWCPGCEEMHVIFDSWSFDGNLDRPTFSPSVRITGKKAINVNGRWTGEWERDASGKAIDACCHYFLRAGRLEFCPDSTHALAGTTVLLPPLPDFLTDDPDIWAIRIGMLKLPFFHDTPDSDLDVEERPWPLNIRPAVRSLPRSSNTWAQRHRGTCATKRWVRYWPMMGQSLALRAMTR